MKTKYLWIVFVIFLILLTIGSIYFFNHYTSQINSGLISCGGKGGSGNVHLQAGGEIRIENVKIDASGGEGGACSIFLQNEVKWRVYELISLIGMIISIAADSLFIYDYFIKTYRK